MTHRLSCLLLPVLLFVLRFPPPATIARAADAGVKCLAGKLKEAGKYGFCRFKAQTKSVKKGTAPSFTKCDDKLTDRWTKLETKAAGRLGISSAGREVSNAVDQFGYVF